LPHHKRLALEVTANMLFDGDMTARKAADWALATDGLLIYSSADPAVVARAQNTYNRDENVSGRTVCGDLPFCGSEVCANPDSGW
jgi:hypothetical protein